MSTYTDSLGLEEITPGDQAGLWGNTTNNNLALIDQAVTGVTPISFTGLSGTVYTLESSNGALDEARAAVLNITGAATGANTIVVPNKQKTYLVRNNTGQNITFRTATPGATYAVQAGNSILVFCDGDNGVFTGIASPSVGTLSVSAGGTGNTTFTAGFVKSTGGTNALTSSAGVALGSDVSGVLPVANGGTGAGTFTAGGLLQGNGTGAVGSFVGGANGQVATWNGSTWVAQAPATGSGTVTSVSGTGTVNGLSLSGTVTTAGSLTLGGSLSGSAPSLSVGSATAASGLTGTPAITVSSVTSSGNVVAYPSSSNYAALQSQSIALFNSTTGMSCDGTTYSWQFSGALRMQLNNAGQAFNSTGTWGTISDARIKENVTPARNYLNDLCQLEVVNYNLKESPQKMLGFVAQQVETVMPGLVDTADSKYYDISDFKSVKTSVLIPMLVQAIQELNAKVDAQAAEITALKAK